MATLQEMATVSKIKTNIVKSERKRSSSWLHTGHCQSLHKSRVMPLGFPTIRDQFVYPTIIHYPLFLYPLFVTRHKLVPSLCIPATAARTWEEKGFVGTWSDGGKGGRVTFQNGGGVSLPSRITKRHSCLVQFRRFGKVSLAIRQCFECMDIFN